MHYRRFWSGAKTPSILILDQNLFKNVIRKLDYWTTGKLSISQVSPLLIESTNFSFVCEQTLVENDKCSVSFGR